MFKLLPANNLLSENSQVSAGPDFSILLGKHFTKGLYCGIYAEYFSAEDYNGLAPSAGTTLKEGKSSDVQGIMVGPVYGSRFVGRHSPRALGLFYSVGYTQYNENWRSGRAYHLSA